MKSLSCIAVTALLLTGCANLPSDGPTGRSVDSAAGVETGGLSYALIELDYATSERIKTSPPVYLSGLMGAASDQPLDVLGEGDTLAVSIFDPGGSLFGTRSINGATQSATQALPPLTVDRAGSIPIPFAGQVRVEGLTPRQAGDAIRAALRGKVANPQVLVATTSNVSNSVVVLGEVERPGRVPIGPSADSIVDVIAAAGGAKGPAEDVQVTINRQGDAFSAPLTMVTSDFAQNVRLRRGDQINLVARPRRFSSFGALGRVSQLNMEAGDLSLAGALSKLGGLDTNSANPSSVLVFRFERPEVARALGVTQAPTARGVPVVYRLNLREPSGLFVADNFMIVPDDIVFAPRARTAELRKFFEFVQTITRVVYDIQVAGTLNNN